MFDLAGKTALVTGATGGIGGDIAKLLASAGAKVALSGTRAERLEAVAAEIGENAVIVPGNLSDPESVANLIKQAEAALGGQLDILVNNAGITRDQLAMRLKDEDWQAVIDVNLTAAFKLARNSLRGMMKRRHGRIINITSIVGVTGNPGQTNYAAAKAGMIGWSKSLAQEVASRGITVNCVAPGFITTAMTNELDEGQKEKLLSNIPAGRMGESTEIAAAVLYLASDEAAYVTGQTLHVNGGMAMI
ncbi:3-oxoacyl-[acyl-carrier-protein] reductase [Thalassospira alkalitolerans]|uniref:3-oxoacyl-[acyl-carrier-protein] reductase n=1 Tax=Thalassospira alkalitolerans TaxID=1293890 RepID=A0A1Y2L794_9PROT|nr:3-oxoacyl-[acyl-carrier-protein] reductase [Thalassospira alkalitolerans]OSQ44903.1 3-oxoacyl-ACP synthase [Thalassospira alkalitolerans]|tara:strand:+ start:1994 stop:2734 length:741 start_codon:yes stop_codon:yes gene_type:complete